MGIIRNGKYYPDGERGELPPDAAVFKQWSHSEQRKVHARDIVQPYNRDGTPNDAFKAAFPDEAKAYGFLPSDEQLRSM